tara:strand:+ start:1687 stop:1941 length:255 start_codon:yes stop_codon:yes gene_type:complete
MKSNYEQGSADSLFERIEADKTGELKEVIKKITDLCKRSSQMGVPMEELATCCTMGWMMGQNPQMEEIFKMMLKTNDLKQNNLN